MLCNDMKDYKIMLEWKEFLRLPRNLLKRSSINDLKRCWGLSRGEKKGSSSLMLEFESFDGNPFRRLVEWNN